MFQRVILAGALVAGVLLAAGQVEAQRLSVFDLHCIGPVNADLGCTLVLQYKVLTFSNRCAGADTHASQAWPAVLSTYGKVEQLTCAANVRNLSGGNYNTPCSVTTGSPSWTSGNEGSGVVAFTCFGNPNVVGEAQVLISISKP